MIRVIRDIFRRTIREKLPKLENTFTSKYDRATIGDDEMLIMLAGVAKDPMEARRLMQEYEVTDALALLAVLPKRKINWRRRLRSYLQGLEGSMTNDPYPDLLWPKNGGRNFLK